MSRSFRPLTVPDMLFKFQQKKLVMCRIITAPERKNAIRGFNREVGSDSSKTRGKECLSNGTACLL